MVVLKSWERSKQALCLSAGNARTDETVSIERNDAMSSLVLTKEEELKVKQALVDFVVNTSNTSEHRRPEDIAILPAMTEILLWKD